MAEQTTTYEYFPWAKQPAKQAAGISQGMMGGLDTPIFQYLISQYTNWLSKELERSIGGARQGLFNQGMEMGTPEIATMVRGLSENYAKQNASVVPNLKIQDFYKGLDFGQGLANRIGGQPYKTTTKQDSGFPIGDVLSMIGQIGMGATMGGGTGGEDFLTQFSKMFMTPKPLSGGV